MAAFGELLDDLGAERRQVVRVPGGDEALVDDDLLVDDLAAGILDVGADAGVGGERPLAHQSASTSNHGPWQMAPTGLPVLKNSWTNETAS